MVMDRPAFVVIAGPNGSGKSSAYTDTQFEQQSQIIWIVNPDLLTSRIEAAEKFELQTANLAAVERLQDWLSATLSVHKSVGMETVLSTDKYRALVEKAHRLGFLFWFIYVVLDSPELNVERVHIRVQKGGHDVPEDKIRSRYYRSLSQMPWFLDRADQAWIYNNSGSRPILIGSKLDGVITIDESAPQALLDALKTIME